MKRSMMRLLYIFLCISILASTAACRLSGFKVTGKIEDGRLTVWYSPKYTQLLSKGYADNAYLYTSFPDDVYSVTFDSEGEFNEKLSQAMTSGDGPDLVLACAYEITAKMLANESLVDLDPFLDYEDKQTSVRDLNEGDASIGSETDIGDLVVKRKDLLMNIIDQAKYDGKLYFIPFGLGVKTLQGNPDNLKYGCLDLYNQTYTPAEFLAAMKKVGSITIGSESYPSFTELPEIQYIFKDFIDYEKKKTRMGEDVTYEYFCAYAQALIDQQDRMNQWQNNHPESWILDENGKQIGTHDTSDDAFYLSFYTVNRSSLWQGINTFINFTYHDVFDASSRRADLDELNLSGAVQPNMPSEYKTKYYVDMNTTVVAAIPACCTHPNKAFTYIKALLSEQYHHGNTKTYSSPNIHCFQSDLEDMGFDDEQVAQYLEEAENGQYTWVWMDSTVYNLFHDFLFYSDTNSAPRKIVPTRDEWNELKNKIETYLNE